MAGQIIAVLYEHPEWFKPLFAELRRRDIAFEPIAIRDHSFNPSIRDLPYRLVVNRVSAYPSGGSHHGVIHYTKELLLHLERSGIYVINGFFPFLVGASKALQSEVFEDLKLCYPRTKIIHHQNQLLSAAADLSFPVLLKPNVGGSGAGIRKFINLRELEDAVQGETIDLGIDNIALVQERLSAKDGCIYRVEILNGEFLYAIRIPLREESFNYCPSDGCLSNEGVAARAEFSYCTTESRSRTIESFNPPQKVIEQVKRIIKRSRADLGGVEYLVNENDNQIYYFDINPLSNFVANAEEIVGFDPLPVFVDFIAELAGRELPMRDFLVFPEDL